MPLRPYQQEALSAVVNAYAEGCVDQLIALPCGTGKTRIASNLPEAFGLHPWEVMLFLVSGETLCFQACEDLREANPNLRVALEKAEHFGDVDADLLVASIDTLAMSPDRLARLAALPIRIVFVDECHGAVSPKFMKVLSALRVLKGEDDRDPLRLHVGLTATPKRHDGIGLDLVYDRIVFRRTIREMAAAGWTAPMIAYRVETDLDMDSVKMHSGDFAIGDLSRTVNTPRLNALVVQKYLEYGAGLPFIEFTVNIEHSEDAARTFRHHGIACEAISGNTPHGKRKELIEAHRTMQLPGLVSCQTLMVGFDSPPATVALWNRPCCSGLFYQQGIGRIGRPYPAPEATATHTGYRKQHGIIVDFTGTSSKHRLYTAATLYGLGPQFDFRGQSISKTLDKLEDLKAANPTLDITAYAGLNDVQAASTSVDLWKPAAIPKLAKHCSQFLWAADGEDRYRLAAPGMSVFLEQNLLGEYEVSRTINGQAPDSKLIFDEPEDAFSYADSLVPTEYVTLIRANARWRKEAPKEAQCAYLWAKDPTVRHRFTDGVAFFRYASHQFQSGNSIWSKGNISMRIEMAKRGKELRALATQR